MSFYDDASWLLIPSGIEEDIVFAQKPTSGLGDLTFTRASDATYTDSTGVVRRSPYNLVQYSEMFSDVAWGKQTATITPNTILSPNGTITADTFTATGSFAFISQAPTLPSGTTVTLSFYVKNINSPYVNLQVRSTVTAGLATFNFTGDTLTSSTITTGISRSFVDVGGGWYRIILTCVTSETNQQFRIQLPNSSNAIYIWGAQVNEGTSALDYFPTTNRQDVPRIDFRNADGTLSSCGRLLLEPQRTNSIRNSSMVGAVAGSPGTLPTNWSTLLSGLTQTAVGIGTESGLPYIDLRFAGVATNTTCEVRLESITQIAALTGQAWNLNTYAKVISGTFNSASLYMFERTSAGIAVTTPLVTVAKCPDVAGALEGGLPSTDYVITPDTPIAEGAVGACVVTYKFKTANFNAYGVAD